MKEFPSKRTVLSTGPKSNSICRRMCAFLSPEIVQAGAMKGLKDRNDCRLSKGLKDRNDRRLSKGLKDRNDRRLSKGLKDRNGPQAEQGAKRPERPQAELL